MERELVDWLRQRLPGDPRLMLGPGDDAAILATAGRGDCVVTVDMLSDEVDFDLRQADPRRVGRKALAVNLSDLAAMASRPLAAVIALLLPQSGAAGLSALQLAQEMYEGLLPLAAQHQLIIAGGDVNAWDHPLAISVTLIGEVSPPGPLTRRGAQPGDALAVTGWLGGSILGKHFDFEPRVAEALTLNQRYELHAGLDISDGLALDLSRLCEESGCGAVLRSADIPLSDAALELARQANDGRSALDRALGDGEDFELLLALPEAEARRIMRERPIAAPLSVIGEIQSQPGLWIKHPDGNRQPLKPAGWQY